MSGITITEGKFEGLKVYLYRNKGCIQRICGVFFYYKSQTIMQSNVMIELKL